jgi:hypothetical protein
MATAKNRRFMAMCFGKRRYRGYDEAARAASHLRRRGRLGLEPYRCPACDHWHLGR